ncbi:PLP-dependent cysteine synthase family protein [Dactylosporangium cerinum]
MMHDDLPAAARERRWAVDALAALRAPVASPPLRHYPLPPEWGISLLLQDHSGGPTGSVKDGTVRRSFEHAIASGWIGAGTTLIDATAGNGAVAAARLAGLLGLPFVAVVPGRTSAAKRARISAHGGRCHPFDPPVGIYDEARRLAQEPGTHLLDHFAWAARSEDWRDASGLAATLVRQVTSATGAPPDWVVTGAGTGATSAAIGRHARFHGLPTRLAVVDPEHSAYFPGWVTGDPGYATGMPSRIEGIGRPRTEPGFLPAVIDLVIPVADGASVAAMRHLADAHGWRAGPSTGANLWGVMHLVSRMRARGERGTVATLICDGGEPYRDTYYNDERLRTAGIEVTQWP